MITRITKENVDKYRALFKEATYALESHNTEGKPINTNSGTPMLSVEIEYQDVSLNEDTFIGGYHYEKLNDDKLESSYRLTGLDENFDSQKQYAIRIEKAETITTLEEYFCHIKDLSILVNDNNEPIGKRFLVLPMESDENFFEINANTREIIVPNAFKQNGVSVQGDAIAEMLYFKIDRYFDMDDLYTKEVLIEWRLPENPETKERLEGTSRPFIKDISISPDHIIIGWPIHQELTKIPGKIEFAVRFYTIGDDTNYLYKDKIMYSFSTLPAVVEIKSSLNLDIEKIDLEQSYIDSNDLIGSRLNNSQSNDDSAPQPAEPVWIETIFKDLPQAYEKIENDGNDTIDTYKIYLTNEKTGEEVNGKFIVQAKTTDTGRLSYSWIKRDEQGEMISYANEEKYFEEALKDEEGLYSKETPDRTYYLQDEKDAYTEFIFTEDMATPYEAQIAGYVLYERKSQAIMNCSGLNVLGSYQPRVINRLGRKTSRIYGPIALVEGPVEPKIVEDLHSTAANASTAFENLKVPVEITAEVDEHAYVTYHLYRCESLDGTGDYVPAEEEPTTSNKREILGSMYNAEEPDADLGDGFYKMSVITKLNSITTSVTGEPIRITHKASPVTIINSTPATGDNYYIEEPLKVEIEYHPAEADRRIEGQDTIDYQWFKYVGPNPDQINADIEKAEKGEYTVSNIDELIPGATEAELQLTNTAGNEQGFYFCRVTNTYNNTVNIKCSNFFNVIDTKVEE